MQMNFAGLRSHWTNWVALHCENRESATWSSYSCAVLSRRLAFSASFGFKELEALGLAQRRRVVVERAERALLAALLAAVASRTAGVAARHAWERRHLPCRARSAFIIHLAAARFFQALFT